jgi:molybdenum cofactor cytidylyltransferase
MKLAQAFRISAGDVLAFTGGGGKTTAMFQLANELAHPRRFRVLTTTSTRIFTAQINRSPAHITFDPAAQAVADVLPALQAELDRHGQVLLIGRADAASGKAFGVPPEAIYALAQTGRFDLIINEADGSRMRSFKAPAAHEPVIPACTTLVSPVVGLDVLGRPLNDDAVHRAGLVSRLSGAAPEQPITPDIVAAVVCHPQGGLKNVPPQARVIPLLNKVDTPEGLAAARALAGRLLACSQIDSVAVGAVQTGDQPILEVQSRTAAIILAAGGSSRFGSPKQLARWGEQTFIERVIDLALASPARPVVVVLGAQAERVRAAIGDRPVTVVINENWAAGQSTSMQAGLAALPATVSSALFLLVDLPAVQPETLGAVISRYRQTLAPVVWPEYEGRQGNPVLFDRALFAALAQVQGDTGGKPLLKAYQTQAQRVAVVDPGILQDFDRPEDLAGHSPRPVF